MKWYPCSDLCNTLYLISSLQFSFSYRILQSGSAHLITDTGMVEESRYLFCSAQSESMDLKLLLSFWTHLRIEGGCWNLWFQVGGDQCMITMCTGPDWPTALRVFLWLVSDGNLPVVLKKLWPPNGLELAWSLWADCMTLFDHDLVFEHTGMLTLEVTIEFWVLWDEVFRDQSINLMSYSSSGNDLKSSE